MSFNITHLKTFTSTKKGAGLVSYSRKVCTLCKTSLPALHRMPTMQTLTATRFQIHVQSSSFSVNSTSLFEHQKLHITLQTLEKHLLVRASVFGQTLRNRAH